MKRSPMARGTSTLRRSRMAPGRKRLGPGKQTRENLASNARLNIRFEAMGITSCELGYEGCKRDDWLSWAHGRKRDKLVGDELDTLVILACTPCHGIIEVKPPAEMLAIVESVIAARAAKTV